MKLGSQAKKRRMQQIDKVISNIESTKSLNKLTPSHSLKLKLLALRQELRSLLLETNTGSKPTHTPLATKQANAWPCAFVVFPPRPGNHSSSTPPLSKVNILDPQGIANAFSNYYESLYNLKNDTSTPQPTPANIKEFLSQINLPTISTSQLEVFNSPFTIQEIAQHIDSLPNYKSPGSRWAPRGILQTFQRHSSSLSVRPLQQSCLLLLVPSGNVKGFSIGPS